RNQSYRATRFFTTRTMMARTTKIITIRRFLPCWSTRSRRLLYRGLSKCTLPPMLHVFVSFPVVLVLDLFHNLDVIKIAKFRNFTLFDGLFYGATRFIAVRAVGKAAVI